MAVADDMLPKSRSTSQEYAELGARNGEDLLRRFEHLAPAGVEEEAVEVLERETVRVEKTRQRLAHALPHQGRKLGAQDDAKPVVLDVPAHDVLGLAPKVVAGRAHPHAPRRAVAADALPVAQDHRRRPVPEQCCRHEHGERRVVDTQAQRAEIERQEQHMRAGLGFRHARRAREPADPAAAPQTEDGNPLDSRPEGQLVHEPGVEARHGETGDRVDDEGIDVADLETRLRDGRARDRLKELKCMALKRGRALLPGPRLVIPVARMAGIARIDARVRVERIEAGELRDTRSAPGRPPRPAPLCGQGPRLPPRGSRRPFPSRYSARVLRIPLVSASRPRAFEFSGVPIVTVPRSWLKIRRFQPMSPDLALTKPLAGGFPCSLGNSALPRIVSARNHVLLPASQASQPAGGC